MPTRWRRLCHAQRNAHAMERMQGSGRVSALWEKRASGRAFIEAQTLLPQPEACSAEGCDRIELLGERLSAAAKARTASGASSTRLQPDEDSIPELLALPLRDALEDQYDL